MKVCTKCGRELPATLEYFHRNGGGLRSCCKDCAAEYRRKNKKKIAEYRRKNKEKIVEYNAEYRRKNKEKIVEYNAEYRRKNKKKIAEYYRKNKEKKAGYYRKNKEKKAEYRQGANKYIDNIIQEIKKYEEVTEGFGGLATFKCAYCGKGFIPTRVAVSRRLRVINGIGNGECRLYCSQSCKDSCPTYRKRKYPGRYRKATSREANPVLRQLVLKRDGYQCRYCGATEYLHCHHVVPATQNPMTANDPDACITLCKDCHKEVHKKVGCKYNELQCA